MKKTPSSFISPDGHWRLFDYDKHGNPLPRSRVVAKPRIAHDREAAREYAEALRSEPDFDPVRMAGWLWTRNAIAHQETIETLREELVARRERQNDAYKRELVTLERKLTRLKEQLARHAPDFEALRIKTGGEVEDGRVVFPTGSGRFAVETVAGRTDIHRGRPNKPWFTETIGWMITIGSGVILGASLGFLTGKLDFAQPDPAAAAVFIGAGLLSFIGASKGLRPLNFKLGQFSFTHHYAGTAPRWVVPGATTLLVLGSALLVGIVNMHVEQFGIFKALSTSVDSEGLKLTEQQLRWVALVVIVPMLLHTMLTQQTDGYEYAAADKVTSLQADAIAEIASSDDGQKFARLAATVAPIWKEIAAIEDKISACESSIRADFSDEEKKQLDEVTNDGIDYTVQALGASNLPSYYEKGGSATAKARGTGPWWRRWSRS